MNGKDIKSILQDALENQIPSAQINLLPAVQARLVAGKKLFLQREENMNNTRTRRKLAVFALTILALLTIVLITPLGRAFAQSVLQFFTRAESDTLPQQQPLQMTPPAQSPSESPSQLSVQEAESLAGYDVLSPMEIPFGMDFMSASYDARYHIVVQAFGRDAEFIGFSLWQQPLEYYQSCGDIISYCDNMLGWDLVGASADVETVQIGDLTGEYVEGTWSMTYSGPVWDPTPYVKILRWQTDKMIFEIVGGVELSRDDLMALAASIR